VHQGRSKLFVVGAAGGDSQHCEIFFDRRPLWFLQKGVTLHSNKLVVNNFARFLGFNATGGESKNIPAKGSFGRDIHLVE
jgi:hypothetical protein